MSHRSPSSAMAKIATNCAEYADEYSELRRALVTDAIPLRLMVRTHRPDLLRRTQASLSQLVSALVELEAIAQQTADSIQGDVS